MTMLPLFITFLLGAVVCLLLLSLSRFVGPRRPTPVKVMPFECGMEQLEKPGAQVPIKFSVVAMLFIIFDIEVAFLYPWALVFREPGFGMFALVEMFVFITLLGGGFVYAWKVGALDW